MEITLCASRPCPLMYRRKRIDFWRPSGIVVRAGSETRKVLPSVLKVHDENTNRRGKKKKSGKATQVFCSNLAVQGLREKDERLERQRKNRGIMMWPPRLRCNDNLHKNKKADQEEKEPVPPILARFGILNQEKQTCQCQVTIRNNQPKWNKGNDSPAILKEKTSYRVT